MTDRARCSFWKSEALWRWLLLSKPKRFPTSAWLVFSGLGLASCATSAGSPRWRIEDQMLDKPCAEIAAADEELDLSRMVRDPTFSAKGGRTSSPLDFLSGAASYREISQQQATELVAGLEPPREFGTREPTCLDRPTTIKCRMFEVKLSTSDGKPATGIVGKRLDHGPDPSLDHVSGLWIYIVADKEFSEPLGPLLGLRKYAGHSYIITGSWPTTLFIWEPFVSNFEDYKGGSAAPICTLNQRDEKS